MKKNFTLSKLLLAMMLIVSIFALSACSIGSIGGDTNGDKEPPCAHIDEGNDGVCDLCGETLKTDSGTSGGDSSDDENQGGSGDSSDDENQGGSDDSSDDENQGGSDDSSDDENHGGSGDSSDDENQGGGDSGNEEDKPSEECTHKWGEWQYDEFTHFRNYVCGCQTPPNSAPHEDFNKDFICDVCEYKMSSGGEENEDPDDTTGGGTDGDTCDHNDINGDMICDSCGASMNPGGNVSGEEGYGLFGVMGNTGSYDYSYAYFTSGTTEYIIKLAFYQKPSNLSVIFGNGFCTASYVTEYEDGKYYIYEYVLTLSGDDTMLYVGYGTNGYDAMNHQIEIVIDDSAGGDTDEIAEFFGAMTEEMTGPTNIITVDKISTYLPLTLCFSKEVTIDEITLSGKSVSYYGASTNEYGVYSVIAEVYIGEDFSDSSLVIGYYAGDSVVYDDVELVLPKESDSVAYVGAMASADATPSESVEVYLGKEATLLLAFTGETEVTNAMFSYSSCEIGGGYWSGEYYLVPLSIQTITDTAELYVNFEYYDALESDNSISASVSLVVLMEEIEVPEFIGAWSGDVSQKSDYYLEIPLDGENTAIPLCLEFSIPFDIDLIYEFYVNGNQVNYYTAEESESGSFVICAEFDYYSCAMTVGEEYDVYFMAQLGDAYVAIPLACSLRIKLAVGEDPKFLGVSTGEISGPKDSASGALGATLYLCLYFDKPVQVMSVKNGQENMSVFGETYLNGDYYVAEIPIFTNSGFDAGSNTLYVEYSYLGQGSYEAEFELVLEELKLLGIYDAKTGEYLGLANEENPITVSATEMRELIFVYNRGVSSAYLEDPSGIYIEGEYIGEDTKLGGFAVKYTFPVFYQATLYKLHAAANDCYENAYYDTNDYDAALFFNVTPGEVKAHGVNTDGYTEGQDSVEIPGYQTTSIYVILSGITESAYVTLEGDFCIMGIAQVYSSSISDNGDGKYAVCFEVYTDPGIGPDMSSGMTYDVNFSVCVDYNPVAEYTLNVQC